MTDQITCTDCGQPMEIGFMRDAVESGINAEGKWHPGVGKYVSGLFGLKRLEVDPKLMRNVTAYCCIGCGALKLYAHPGSE